MATKGTKVPAIKNIPAKTDPELRSTLDSLKEAVEVRLGRRGDPRDRAITLRELIDSGLAKELRNNPFDPNAGVGALDFIPGGPGGDLAIPPAPTGLEASGAFTEIIISWNAANYGNHAYTEVYRSRNDEVGGAILVTTTNSFIITDPVGYNQEYYYWVRFVSTSNVPGPFNGTNGTKATTLEDIAAVMEQLSEELQNLPGYTALTTLITNADVAVAATAAVAARVIRSSGSPSTREDSSALTVNDIWFDTDDGQVYTRNAANNAWVAGRDATLVNVFGATSFTGSTLTAAMASAQSDIVTVTNAQSSTASSLTSLTTTVTNNNNTLTSAISTEASTRSSADSTNATNISNLTSTINNGSTGLAAAHSAISSEATTRANRDTALTTLITNLTSTVGTNTSAISTETTARTSRDTALTTLITNLTSTVGTNTSAISTEATTRANADSANATAISNLSSTVGTTNSNVSTLQTSVSNLEGDADAMFVIQVATESNGSKSAAGMVIGSNASSGSGSQSYVQFQADKFAVWSGSSSVAPFIISSGVVYIDDARIKDGAITNARILNGTIQSAKIGDGQIVTAKIGDAQITTAKIANLQVTNALIADATIDTAKIDNLNAGKINAGTISADRIAAGSIVAAKLNVTDLILPISRGTVSNVGPWYNNQMRLIKIADLGTATGIYRGYVRIFGSNGEVKTLSVVLGDGTFGGSGNELRSDIAINNNLDNNGQVVIADTGYAQYHSGQTQYFTQIDRFFSTRQMVQLDVSVRKTSNTSRSTSLYILAQGNGGPRYLSSVQYAFQRFAEA